jgi:hypothetical protein
MVAWDYAVRGRWHVLRLTKEDNAEAQRLLREGLELYPNSVPILRSSMIGSSIILRGKSLSASPGTKTEAARLSAALLDQFGATVKPGKLETLDIDDTFCAAHGGQQLAFWNAHHDERGFASMHIYHVASGTPVAAILRPARTPNPLRQS